MSSTASGSKGREGEEICIHEHDHVATLVSKQGTTVMSLSTFAVMARRVLYTAPLGFIWFCKLIMNMQVRMFKNQPTNEANHFLDNFECLLSVLSNLPAINEWLNVWPILKLTTRGRSGCFVQTLKHKKICHVLSCGQVTLRGISPPQIPQWTVSVAKASFAPARPHGAFRKTKGEIIWQVALHGYHGAAVSKQWQWSCQLFSGGPRATVPTCPCVTALDRSWNVFLTLHAYPVMLHWCREWQSVLFFFFLYPSAPFLYTLDYRDSWGV